MDEFAAFALMQLALAAFEESPTSDTALALAEAYENRMISLGSGPIATRKALLCLVKRDEWLARAAELESAA